MKINQRIISLLFLFLLVGCATTTKVEERESRIEKDSTLSQILAFLTKTRADSVVSAVENKNKKEVSKYTNHTDNNSQTTAKGSGGIEVKEYALSGELLKEYKEWYDFDNNNATTNSRRTRQIDSSLISESTRRLVELKKRFVSQSIKLQSITARHKTLTKKYEQAKKELHYRTRLLLGSGIILYLIGLFTPRLFRLGVKAVKLRFLP